MQFKNVQWLFPVAVLFHNGEEAIWMPKWVAEHASRLPVRVPGAGQIRIALLGLTLAALVATYLSSRKGPESFWAYLTFGYIVAMLANVFLPHVPATLIFHSYTPGVVTAVLVNLPLMSYLVFRALRDRWVARGRAGMFAVGVPLVLAGLIGFVFYS
jgi:hypothetical protein